MLLSVIGGCADPDVYNRLLSKALDEIVKGLRRQIWGKFGNTVGEGKAGFQVVDPRHLPIPTA